MAMVFPMTPPEMEGVDMPISASTLFTAVHVISEEAAALSNLAALYTNDKNARNGLSQAIDSICTTLNNNGKLVVGGMGKSGKIGQKFVATMNSLGKSLICYENSVHADPDEKAGLGLTSVFLNPAEALHGDMGILRPDDTLLLISYSGATNELLQLVPYIHPRIPLIAMTSHLKRESCPLTQSRPNSIVLPAPVLETERETFGVSAPTTSTTVALALCDALSLSVAEEMHKNNSTNDAMEDDYVSKIETMFIRNHPANRK